MTESSKTFQLVPSTKSLSKVFGAIVPRGTPIPDQFIILDKKENPKLDNTAVAHWLENKIEAAALKNGILYNKGQGPDIPYYNMEYKTRMIESRSYHTVGTTNLTDLITNSWDKSHLKGKVQIQLRTEYSQNYMEVTETRVYDFRDKDVQEYIAKAYDLARDKICKDYAAGKIQRGYTFFKEKEYKAHFDLKSATYCPNTGNILTGSFQFRLGNSYLQSMKSIAMSCRNLIN